GGSMVGRFAQKMATALLLASPQHSGETTPMRPAGNLMLTSGTSPHSTRPRCWRCLTKSSACGGSVRRWRRGGVVNVTREDVLSLSGRELDAAVAERVLGWKRGDLRCGDMPWYPPGTGRYLGDRKSTRLNS